MTKSRQQESDYLTPGRLPRPTPIRTGTRFIRPVFDTPSGLRNPRAEGHSTSQCRFPTRCFFHARRSVPNPPRPLPGPTLLESGADGMIDPLRSLASMNANSEWSFAFFRRVPFFQPCRCTQSPKGLCRRFPPYPPRQFQSSWLPVSRPSAAA